MIQLLRRQKRYRKSLLREEVISFQEDFSLKKENEEIYYQIKNMIKKFKSYFVYVNDEGNEIVSFFDYIILYIYSDSDTDSDIDSDFDSD